MPNSVLTAQGLTKAYGGVRAVTGFDLSIELGHITGLVGPNGAGKSTALQLISGFVRPDAGSVQVGDRQLVGRSVSTFLKAGVARTFQEPSPLPRLSVLENVLVGLHRQGSVGTLRAVSVLGARSEERRLKRRARELLEIVGLTERVDARATDLSFGEMRFLEIARVLGTESEFILMDEPAAGMGRSEVALLSNIVRRLAADGKGILIIDHDMRFVFDVCERVTVMDAGVVIARGTPTEIAADRRVREAYLGDHQTEVSEVASA